MRWFKRFLKLLALLLVAAAAAAAFYAQRSLPQTNGQLQLGGLGGPVKVHRDASDVTHILASRPADAWNFISGAWNRLNHNPPAAAAPRAVPEFAPPSASDTGNFCRP